MADDVTTLTIKRYDSQDPRLGRHIVHDSRSLRYRYLPRKEPRLLSSIRHQMHIPILDQLDVGSCTGHAITAACGGEAFWPITQQKFPQPLNAATAHAFAEDVYGKATELDPWPGTWRPEDTGSDGLSVAKAMQGLGMISGYQHATSLTAALNALAERPVIVGTDWLSGMYDPAADGKIVATGTVEGGHEYCLDELDVARQRVWIRQSWSEQWGLQGRAWMSWADLGKLLANYGDCTVLVPATLPPPKPEPVPPKKVDVDLANALRRLLDNKSAPTYMKAPAKAWLEDLAKEQQG